MSGNCSIDNNVLMLVSAVLHVSSEDSYFNSCPKDNLYLNL